MDTYVFNPFAEGYIARGKAFTPVKHQLALASDLANLPQFLAKAGDLVLTPRPPTKRFLAGLQKAGFAIPEFHLLKTAAFEPENGLLDREIGKLRPWAWGPDSVALFRLLFARAKVESRRPDQVFNEGIAQLYSKTWSADRLREVLAKWQDLPWLCSHEQVGATLDTAKAVWDTVAAIRQLGHERVVLKQALGLAGNNAIRIWEPEVLPTQRRWVDHALYHGQTLVVEPWLERVADFSVQFEMEENGLQFCGYTGLQNDLKGQYQGNWAEPAFHTMAPTLIRALLQPAGCPPDDLHRLYADIRLHLESALRQAGYLGPVGVDALVYRTPTGECRLKPIVEINPRFTMGRLTLELMRQVGAGKSGHFRLVSLPQIREEGFKDFTAYARHLHANDPILSPLPYACKGRAYAVRQHLSSARCGNLELSSLPAHIKTGLVTGEPKKKITGGTICLNDPESATACLALLKVTQSPVPEDAAENLM